MDGNLPSPPRTVTTVLLVFIGTAKGNTDTPSTNEGTSAPRASYHLLRYLVPPDSSMSSSRSLSAASHTMGFAAGAESTTLVCPMVNVPPSTDRPVVGLQIAPTAIFPAPRLTRLAASSGSVRLLTDIVPESTETTFVVSKPIHEKSHPLRAMARPANDTCSPTCNAGDEESDGIPSLTLPNPPFHPDGSMFIRERPSLVTAFTTTENAVFVTATRSPRADIPSMTSGDSCPARG